MGRPVTLFTGQWADLSFEDICTKASAWGYDGLEIACWGDHMDVRRAASDPAYVAERLRILEKHNLRCWALGAHLAGQCVGDRYDDRLLAFAPADTRGKPEALRRWATEEMTATARAARAMGCNVVTGFMGSPIWHAWYSFPPTTEEMVEAAFQEIRQLWTPIFDEFDRLSVRFALEVHPTEIAFDLYTAAAPAAHVRQPSDARVQLRPEPPRVAGTRAPSVHPRIRVANLPRAHEGRERDAGRPGGHPRIAPAVRRPAARVELPVDRPRRRELRATSSAS